MPFAGAAIDEESSSVQPRESANQQAYKSRRLALQHWDEDAPVQVDIIAHHVSEYDDLVGSFIAPRLSDQRREFAYGRLLGVRGTLCRLCPSGATPLLPDPVFRKWHRAESLLRDFLDRSTEDDALLETVGRVEAAWLASAEAYTDALMCKMRNAPVEGQLGLLKSVDAVALHLAQREVFRQTKTLRIPLTAQHEMKLRMRLISLYVMLHSDSFETSLPVIQRYRQTFRISDPMAYPWWFMDMRLTDRQLAWTYRRLDTNELAWRF